MFSEEEEQLYYAVRKAQLNRNTATKILEWYPSNVKQLIAGSFIRILIKLPLDCQSENYAIAYVKGTVEGQWYSGFSTDARQETKVYLLAALPRTLAEINGTQFQLNTISNSRMNADEFLLWLQLSRNEGAPLPSISDLNATAERIRACEIAHRSSVGLRSMPFHGNSHMNISPSSQTTALPQNSNRRSEMTPEHLQFLRSNAQRQSMLQHQQQYSRARLLSNTGTSLPSPATFQPNNAIADLSSSNNIVLGGNDYDTGVSGSPARETGLVGRFRTTQQSSMAGGNPDPSQITHADSGIHYNGYPNQTDGPQNVDLTSLSSPSNLVGSPAATCGDQHTPGACSSYSQLQLTTLQTNTEPQEESEDASLERALRQGIMNNLQQTCLLFPKVASRYKLCQLRLVERDMIEYLQQVREEISAKQENCVVCMDHVPTVILLPCRHKVMCRLCAPSCGNCPVCRSIIKEMFEITEI